MNQCKRTASTNQHNANSYKAHYSFGPCKSNFGSKILKIFNKYVGNSTFHDGLMLLDLTFLDYLRKRRLSLRCFSPLLIIIFKVLTSLKLTGCSTRNLSRKLGAQFDIFKPCILFVCNIQIILLYIEYNKIENQLLHVKHKSLKIFVNQQPTNIKIFTMLTKKDFIRFNNATL